MGLLDDYTRQALQYDRTRAASPAVMGPLLAALAAAPGPRLLDIGGGTGNYAAALREVGFEPLVVDRSEAMLKRAKAKGLPTVEGDATRLPIRDASFDSAIAISMLHHVDEPATALTEAARALVPGGTLVALVFTRDDAERLWVLDRFPSSRPWMMATHADLDLYLDCIPGSGSTELVLDDIRDASLAALCSRPDLMLEHEWRAQTSYFERMERDHAEELAAGLSRLGAEVAAGTAPSQAGSATLIHWKKPVPRVAAA